MKIAVFGGSFNPVHNGHCEMVKGLQEQMSFDKILVIPAFVPPHKSSDDYAKSHHRLKMCSLAFEGFNDVLVSDIEISAEQISYTYKTLLQLKEIYKNVQLFLVCGADMFLTLQTWKNPEIIFQNATVCAFSRDNTEQSLMEKQKDALENLGAKVVLLNGDIPAVSSTQIREKVKKGEDISSLVPKKVKEYINDNEIYR